MVCDIGVINFEHGNGILVCDENFQMMEIGQIVDKQSEITYFVMSDIEASKLGKAFVDVCNLSVSDLIVRDGEKL